MQVQYIFHNYIRYILLKGAAEHGNQPVQNRTTGRPLIQGGSSWTTSPAAAVPAQKLVLNPACLNFATSRPALLQKPIHELVEQFKRSDVIPTNHKCIAEGAHTLSYERSWSNDWQKTIHKFLKGTMRITARLNLQMLAAKIVQHGHQASPRKKVRHVNRRKTRMIWGHVMLPLCHMWQ